MSWEALFTPEAKGDLLAIRDYVARELGAPSAAAKLVRNIIGAARSLQSMPMHNHLFEAEPWRSRGLRVMSVANYLLLYHPDEASQTVRVIRIMYGGRDIAAQLQDSKQEPWKAEGPGPSGL